MSNYLSLQTANCIVTGEKATCWTGHVVAKTFEHDKVSIEAGFKDMETLEAGFKDMETLEAGFKDMETLENVQAKNKGSVGCFGDWKAEDGLQVAWPKKPTGLMS